MVKRLVGVGLAVLAALALTAISAAAQTLDKIKQRGVLVVGTKPDYKPFGFRDPSGAIIGFEPDMAKDVADKLGVKLELEPVVSSNRMQFLQQGKIDLMIATMNDKPDRRQVVGILEPSYYASGVNILANKKAGLKSWEQLKGQKVCGIQGAWYNGPSPKNTAPISSPSRDRPRPRRRSCRATASAGSTTTRRSPSASPIRNGPASK